jgi:3-mercaptopyruvate sulfurtransferase SseA
LKDPKVRIIESNEDVSLYDTGHIPGAVHVDWHKDLNDQTIRDYLDPDHFAALASQIAITPETTLVFYGDKSNWWACYALWVFALFGHKDLRILDGGRDKWIAEGRPVTKARIGFDQVVGFITANNLVETQQIAKIGARDLLASLDSPLPPVILDVRSAQEWRQDHLEGAIHIPLPQLLGHIGGFSRKTPLTVVCASGYRSAIAASLLESEGFERVSNVVGGMGAVRDMSVTHYPASKHTVAAWPDT